MIVAAVAKNSPLKAGGAAAAAWVSAARPVLADQDARALLPLPENLGLYSGLRGRCHVALGTSAPRTGLTPRGVRAARTGMRCGGL
jgi:hypothetical protein